MSTELEPAAVRALVDDPGIWLGSSALLDLEDPKLRLRAQSITQLRQSEREKALALYSFVKQMPFSKSFKMRLHTAREVLNQQSGDSADKATLLVALLRLGGFPARMRYLTLRGEIMRGLLAGMPEPTRPVVEIYRDGIWVGTDTYIFDPRYLAAARDRLQANGWERGYGIHVEGSAVWDGVHPACTTTSPADRTDTMLLQDHGPFCDPLEFISSDTYRERHGRVARAMRWNLSSMEMDRAIRELRESRT